MRRPAAAAWILFVCSIAAGTPAFGQTTVAPYVVGSLTFFPEFGIGPRVQSTDSVRSVYFRTTADNRQFDRGFAEFALPLVPDLFRATARFDECHGWTAFPLPPDIHELSYYPAADLQVDAADWDRPTTLVTTLETDVNRLELASFSVNVTDMVIQYQGSAVGLRFKLAADPALLSFGFAGSQFCNVRIEAVTITEAPLQLISDIGLLGLPHGLGSSLTAKLQAVHAALLSGNTASACGILAGFTRELAAQAGSQQGDAISEIDAANLLGAVTAMVEALGCRQP